MLVVNIYNISQFAAQGGVAVKTLQRANREGKLKPAACTPTNRRLKGTPRCERVVVAYLRVSSQAQRRDLANQKAVLEQFCIARGIAVDEWISEFSGGLNFKRPKFSELVDRVIHEELSTLAIAHQDRLARFGFELLTHLCETHDCQIVELNTESLSPEQEMVQDMMTIIDCFSSRLTGLQNYHRAVQKALQDG